MKILLKIGISVLVIFSLSTAKTQINCGSGPLKIDEVQPIWAHQLVDSSIIGYIDSVEVLNNAEFNGLNHFAKDGGSFVDGDYLYSITNVNFDFDIVGYHVQKISLTDGTIKWTIKSDRRNDLFDHKIMQARIDGNKLIVDGVRPVEKDAFILSLDLGWILSYYFRREYDVDTGELLNEWTPDNEDSTAFQFKTQASRDYNYFGDEYLDHFQLMIYNEDGTFLIRTTTDRLGNIISEGDTVVVGDYNEYWEEQIGGGFAYSRKLIKKKDREENKYLYIQEFIPKSDSNRDVALTLTEYDEDFNEIRKKDLTELPLGDVGSIQIISYQDGRIVLFGCQNLDRNNHCDQFIYVLDEDWHTLRTVLLIDDEEQQIKPSKIKNIVITEQDEIIISSHQLERNGNSLYRFYRSNVEETFINTSTMKNQEINQGGFIYSTIRLANGDFLVKFLLGCIGDSDTILSIKLGTTHEEWWRISAEEFELMVATQDDEISADAIQISPNPVYDLMQISIDDPIIGTIRIFDMQGRIIYTSVIDFVSDELIDVSAFVSGTYILEIISEDGNVQRSRFVKGR